MPLLVHGQTIDPRVAAFRKEWFSSEEKRLELKRRKSEIGIQYSNLLPSQLTTVSPHLAEVDISSFRPEWEDADTLLLHSPWWKFQDPVAVRLTGIDAPEIAHPGDPTEWMRYHQEQPFGREALGEVEKYTSDKDLRVFVGTRKDQRTYNRYLGVVTADDTPVNIEALRRGWAAALPWGEAGSDILPRNELIAIEREASRRGEGLWGHPFFQKYRDVSRGLGGRLTFNTLTDLSRLSRNYHLAAVESYLSHTGTPRDPSLGNYLGNKLIPSYGRFFSGHNSAYNTIEGMSHKGLAGKRRKVNTDFGSGYQGSKVDIRTILNNITQETPSSHFETVKKHAKWLHPGHYFFHRAEQLAVLEATEFGVGHYETKLQDKLRNMIGREVGVQGVRDWSALRGAYNPINNMVMYGAESPLSVMAHEFGHVATMKRVPTAVMTIGKTATIAGSQLASLLIPVDRDESTSYKVGVGAALGLAPIASHLPIFLAEQKATQWALQSLEKVGYKGIKAAEKTLSAAFRTYPAGALFAGAMNVGIWAWRAGRAPLESTFSAHNSAYNTIEGMRHGGWAGARRPTETDFGSGLTTGMFGSVKAFMQASRQSARKTVRRELNPLKVARSEIDVLERGPAAGRVGFLQGKYTEQISWSQEGVEAMFRGKGIDPELTTLTTLFHEGSEVAYGRKIIQKTGASTAEEANMAFSLRSKFGSHISPGVIVDEVLMAMKEGPEAFQAMKQFRAIEKENIRSQFAPKKQGFLGRLFGRKETPSLGQQQAESYISRVEKIYQTMEKNYLPKFAPRFSADHGAWNTISGMQHSGMSADMRKVNTDFGSRSDPLRAIARGLGLSFENLLRSPAWKEALGGVKHIKRLSAGSFGEAHMFRTTIHGKEISMVRKTIHGEAEKNLQALAARDAAGTGRTIEEAEAIYRKSMDLSREGGFYRALGETPSVPSFYGMTKQKQELWMEYMPGEELASLTQKQPHFKMPAEARAEIEETMSTAIEMGIFNPDIHSRNILYSSAGKGRASILDFGQTEARKQLTTRDVTTMHERLTGTAGVYKSEYEIQLLSQESARKGLEHARAERIGPEAQSIAAGPRARKKQKKLKQLQQAEDLRRAKAAAWEAAYHGGSNHIVGRSSSSGIK